MRTIQPSGAIRWMRVTGHPVQSEPGTAALAAGTLKMWAHLQRQGITVARCTVERIMRNRWVGCDGPSRSRPRSATPPRTEPRPTGGVREVNFLGKGDSPMSGGAFDR
jgi:hypothetical protein